MKRLVLPLLVLSLVLLAYAGLIYLDNYGEPGRMRETPAIRPHEEPILPLHDRVVPTSGGEALYRAARAENLKSPVNSKEQPVIETGKKLYFTYCAQCHGKYHDGNGTVGQSFAPLPTDLRSRKVQSMIEGQLFRDISYGVPKGRQPPLATTIEFTDRWRIVAYVKSLGLRK